MCLAFSLFFFKFLAVLLVEFQRFPTSVVLHGIVGTPQFIKGWEWGWGGGGGGVEFSKFLQKGVFTFFSQKRRDW